MQSVIVNVEMTAFSFSWRNNQHACAWVIRWFFIVKNLPFNQILNIIFDCFDALQKPVSRDMPPFRPPFFTSGTPSDWVFKCQTYSCWVSLFHFEPLFWGNTCEIFVLSQLFGSFLWKFDTPVGVKFHPADTPVGAKILPADPSSNLIIIVYTIWWQLLDNIRYR